MRYRIADAMITSHLRHTWCLTLEVVVFFLFDEDAPARLPVREEKCVMH